MFCRNCGTPLAQDSAFCAKCGTPVNKTGQAAPQTKKRSKGKILLWVGIIGGVLVSALCIVVAICLLLGVFSIGAIGIFLGLSTQKTSEPVGPQSPEVVEPQDPLMGNPYAEVYQDFPQYVLPNIDSQYYCYEDIKHLSDEELWVALHEVTARHGATFFEDADVQAYFAQRQWYQPSNQAVELNDYEDANQTLLQVQYQKRKGLLDTDAYPDLLHTEDYILPESGTRNLMEWELLGKDGYVLNLARNEIMARHGYIFSSMNLRLYFYSKPWYKPSTQGTDFDFGCLSSVESNNISLIQAYEKIATKTGQSIPYGYVNDQYTYAGGEGCLHIPEVNLSVAKSVNKQIYDVYYEEIQEDYFAYEYPDIYQIAYNVGQKEHILSITVGTTYYWDYTSYRVYNLSTVTGKLLSDEEVYGTYGLTEEQARERLISALNKCCARMFDGVEEEEYKAFLKELRDMTLSDENISNAKPYIDSSGKLCFVVEIYVPAGAGVYPYLIDQSGNYQYISCACN